MSEGSYGTLNTMRKAGGRVTLTDVTPTLTVTLPFTPDVIFLCGKDSDSGTNWWEGVITGDVITNGSQIYLACMQVRFTGNGNSFILNRSRTLNPLYYLAVKF